MESNKLNISSNWLILIRGKKSFNKLIQKLNKILVKSTESNSIKNILSNWQIREKNRLISWFKN